MDRRPIAPAAVHWRVVEILLAVAAAKFEIEPLLASLALRPDSLAQMRWVCWDHFCDLLEGLARIYGGPEALAKMPLLGHWGSAISTLSRAFVSPTQLHRFVVEVMATMAMPALEIESEQLSERKVRVAYRVRDGLRDSEAFGHLARRGLDALGSGSRRIEATVGPRLGEYVISLPLAQERVVRAPQRKDGVEMMLAVASQLTTDRTRLDAREPGTVVELESMPRRLAATRARFGLTPRQLEVLSHVIRGRANKEIAAALGCAENTVELHVTELLRKLTVKSRTELTAKFWSEL